MELSGRGAGYNPKNRFISTSIDTGIKEGADEPFYISNQTRFYIEEPKNILSRNDSPDIPFNYSINPYQGCEHGCAYCYARNTHEYWGFSAGVDFESKIMVKPRAPELLAKVFLSGRWKPETVMLSGNTDCYQPVEKKLKITRSLLKVFLDFRNPVSIITKNALVLRDMDILSDLATLKLTRIFMSVTTLNEKLRLALEPRTTTAGKKFRVMEKLSQAGVPVGVMIGPVIPGLNAEEIPSILKMASEHGAVAAGMSMARFNGPIAGLFRNWLENNFPDRIDKIWNQVSEFHGGRVHDSQWGRRMKGQGKIAESIHFIFNANRKKYFRDKKLPDMDLSLFRNKGMIKLF